MIYGFDIGGTKIEFVVFDDRLEAISRERIATPVSEYGRFLEALERLVRTADQVHGSAGLVGIGMPGLVDNEGRFFCANILGATGQFVARDFAALIGREVAIENDCRLFALSESVGGAGQDHHVVFGAILGTGAAGGLAIGGQLERGQRGIAGEFGHLPISAQALSNHRLPLSNCACGLTGCLEAYVAGPGLLRMANQLGVEAQDTQDVVAAWRSGDPAARQTYHIFVDLVGQALANVVKMTDPGVIIMGGGLSQIDELIGDLPDAISRHLFKGFASPPVMRARFGDSSGVRGAALLAAARSQQCLH